jgi:peptide/nickel transport system substrate-binding protein
VGPGAASYRRGISVATRRSRILAAAGAAALLAGIGLGAGAPASAADPVVLTVGITQDIDSANPFTGYLAEAYEIYQLEYPTLLNSSPEDFSPVPGLAESWQESADKKTWTYKLRAGMKWSDGTPLTAKDAAYTFNRILTGEYEKTNFGSYTANITKAEATDDTTLVLTVSQPSPIMERLAVYILPEHIWKDIDEKKVQSYKNEGTEAAPTVGAGPFVMVERQVGQFIRLKANDNFYGGRPAVDELVFKIYSNGDALGQALKKGEIDFADSLSANVYDSLQGAEGITAVSAQYSGFNELAFNTGAALDDGTPIGDGNPLLKDKALRQAIGWAIDRQTLVDKVLGGGGSPGSTIIPPIYPNLQLQPANPVGFDPEKAKQLLDAAGYTVGSDGIRQNAAGDKLTFRLYWRTESEESKKSAQFIKGWLAAVGIEIKDKGLAADGPLTEVIGAGNFDMFEWGWVVEPDPNYQLSTFTCANRSYKDGDAVLANLSDSFYCNPEYDKLFDQQSLETDSAKRTEIVKQMQQMLYDDAPYVVTYYYDNREAYRSDRFTGFVPQPSPNGSLLFQYGTWSYENVKPVSAESPAASGSASASTGGGTTESSSSNVPLIVGGVVALLAVLGIGVAVGRRGGRSDDDEE